MRQDSGYHFEDMPGPERRQSNPLAIVGFVLSFCLSPIGLLLSLLALLRAPRGFAFAGVAVGLIGSVIWAVIGGGIYLAVPVARDTLEITSDVKAIVSAINTYKSANDGALPADLTTLSLSQDELTDPWGTPYRYDLSADAATWKLLIAGPDAGFDDTNTVTIQPDFRPDDIQRAITDTLAQEMIRYHFDKPQGTPTP